MMLEVYANETDQLNPNKNETYNKKIMTRDKQTKSQHLKGLVIVITGNGKGKTTSALGQALRATGHGYSIGMVQFMKGRKYGEVIAAEKYLPHFTVFQYGLDSFG